MSDYDVEHWTESTTVERGGKQDAISISVNDRAATRQAIINRIRRSGMNFISRSDWAAHKNRPAHMKMDWNYTKIAIHHAGRSFTCGPGALQLQDIQEMQMGRKPDSLDDIGYHYALDCFGNVFEGRDIRFRGENVHNFNTGLIGIVLLENLTMPEEGRDIVTGFRTFIAKMGGGRVPAVPQAQHRAVSRLVDVLCDFFHIHTLGGHREFPGQLGEGKVCPGHVGLALANELRQSKGLNAP
jgi:hypothetical protein